MQNDPIRHSVCGLWRLLWKRTCDWMRRRTRPVGYLATHIDTIHYKTQPLVYSFKYDNLSWLVCAKL